MNSASNLHCCSVFLLCYFILPISTIAIDTITATQPLTKNQTLISSSDTFELGFFSPGNSEKLYVGIWYKKLQPRKIVWVLNRDSPISNPSSPILILSENGNLVLTDESENLVWLSNLTSSINGHNTVAQILDSGNLVIKLENDDNPENFLWESFNFPTDTMLPGMKLGWDKKTGLNRYITSWKSTDDPSTGDFSFKLELIGFPEFFLRNKEVKIYRSGPWNGLRFSGVPEMKQNTNILSFSFVMDENEIEYSFSLKNNSVYSRLMVSPSGLLQRFTWIETTQTWSLFWYARKDQCDNYKECGVYGICDTNSSPVCKCMRGFEPKNLEAWNLRDGSDGCVRKTKLECSGDGFLKLSNMKLPEATTATVDKEMDAADCEEACRKNCSCKAYGSVNISMGGSGCAIWGYGLSDLRQYAVDEGGQDLFVRVAASDLEEAGGSKGSSSEEQILKVTGIAVGVIIFLVGLTIVVLWRRRIMQKVLKRKIDHRGVQERSQDFVLNEGIIVSKRDYSGESTMDELDLPLFEFDTLAMATSNFSDENKLGQGGFGSVYQGMLMEGDRIAVKRLSKNSGQGTEEFKNEVRLIARLQHRNLVRLLGCSIDMEEKMLIYEYMENKSLDYILFSKEKCSLLDWQRRFNIICGIARGLLYLHQDSRFRIIHRDLKASNILLDKEMNPKISDFGMARIFGGDQTEANTKRVVGTYGYMSPEYAMDGLFSVKSDVFSFGVLVLEIVSGKKNKGFYHANQELNLLGHAWRLWREGNGIDLMDSCLGNSYSPSEVMRCVHVGLLCVQERAKDRPTMASVVLMLSSENASMAQPKLPGFCVGAQLKPFETDSSSSKQDESCTVNQVTVTILDGR